MNELAVKIENYKCFKQETGFERILKVNLIVGRNNAGKSSLLDLIEAITSCQYVFDQSTWCDRRPPRVIFSSKIPEDVVHKTFPVNTAGGRISGNHRGYGEQYIGRKIKWAKAGNSNGTNCTVIECEDEGISPRLSASGIFLESLPQNMNIPIEGKRFRRLSAERDIIPETSSSENIRIDINGNGLTNAIQNFINKSSLPSDLVEIKILEALNTVFAHDAIFTDIVCQLHDNTTWEIYLEEEHKGRISLSRSGSGLKTVISVLSCLILVPHLEEKPLSEYIFGFEEIENNIHPALLRRLNDYIYKSAIENDFSYFLTTHSNVLIDQFSKQSDAQIIHVTQKNSKATCSTSKTYVDNNGILDDLDVRASDLLQANGIIWVEGPSDRIYLNRWIDLWSEGELKEGAHYQIIFYGGRLLSHLDAEAPEDVEAGISILNANRNAIMLIDSDKRNQQTPINNTKQRIRDEFDRMNSLCWVTKGREIENYIPPEVINSFWMDSVSSQVGKYVSFFDYIDEAIDGEGTRYNGKKPLLAEKLAPHMTKANLLESLDLDDWMTKICEEISSWNS